MLFYINILFAVTLFFYYSLETARKGMFLSPHMIIWGIPLVVILYPALQSQSPYINDFEFNLVITVGLLGSLYACLTIDIPSYVENKSGANSQNNNIIKYELPSWLISYGALVYAAYLGATVVILVIKNGGILNALIVSRLQDYLEGGILVGQTYQMLFLVPEILYYFYIGRLLGKRRYISAAFAASVISLFFVFTSNTRLPMIMPFMALSIVMFTWIKRQLMPFVMPVIMITGVSLVFAFSVIGNAIRGGNINEINQQFSNFKETVSNLKSTDLSYYDWLFDLYSSIIDGKINYDLGFAWFYYAPISFFPRFLWPGKPLTSTSNRLTEAVYDITIGEGQPITTFTIYGEGFWQASYLGVFLAGYFMLFLNCVLISQMLRFKYSEYWIALILLQMVTYVRAELPIVPFILNVIILAIFYNMREKKDLVSVKV